MRTSAALSLVLLVVGAYVSVSVSTPVSSANNHDIKKKLYETKEHYESKESHDSKELYEKKEHHGIKEKHEKEETLQSEKPEETESPLKPSEETHNGLCGPKHGSCPDKLCCSLHNECGVSTAHCNVYLGCKRKFGSCD